MKELILGGARSGKSAMAQQHAHETSASVIYVATATAGDDEMTERIERHRQDRPENWQLIEEPIALATILTKNAAADKCIIVDCLTLWLANLLEDTEKGLLERERDALLKCVSTLPGHIIFVSNEVGMGIVPVSEVARHFRDEAGRLHQSLAQVCDLVTLCVAGLSYSLKELSE